jgi:uncharacterized membrane protein
MSGIHHHHREAGWRGVLAWLRNRFLTGLAVAVPLVATLFVVGLLAKFVFTAGDRVLDFVAGVLSFVARREVTVKEVTLPFLGDVNLLSVTVPVLTVILLVALGAAATNVIGRRVVAGVDSALESIPFVSFIYKATRQVIESFKGLGQQRNFKRVAFIEYPSPGCRLLGFVTGQYYDAERARPVTSVFLPTSPNPITGFIVVVDDDRVIDSAMSLEDATKMIISAGLVTPACQPLVPPPPQAQVPPAPAPAAPQAAGARQP